MTVTETVAQTAEEVFDSLTGFDEIAIAQHFGRTVGVLVQTDETMFGRALVFVVKRREGASDDEARNAAFEMPLKVVSSGFFAEASEDEAGKEPEPVEQPASSLSSVS